MREIKFRGKTIKDGSWIYGYLVMLCEETCPALAIGSDSFHLKGVKPETVGQLWKPSLNLEVYGGDLLECECSPSGINKVKTRICLVNDTEEGFGISVWYKREWWVYSRMNFATAKVIGNIHENPDLL